MESTEMRVFAHFYFQRLRTKGCASALLVALALISFREARGQGVAAYDIRPTVTASMGDVGGKFFGQVPDPAKTHHYYIAAEPVKWDFMPIGSDPICGMTPPPNIKAWH